MAGDSAMSGDAVGKVRGRLLKGVWGSPGVYVPGFLGIAGLAASAAMHNPLFGLGSLGLLLGGLGMGLTRWINLPEEEVKSAVDSVRSEAAEERGRMLKDLIKRLEEDKDPRPETYLGQLMGLEDAIRELGRIKGLPPSLRDGIRRDMAALVDRSARICQETIDLHVAGARMPNDQARRILTRQREAKVAELQACVGELEAVLQDILAHGGGEDRESALGVRERLRRNLQAARDIDEKTRDDESEKLEALRARYRPGADGSGT